MPTSAGCVFSGTPTSRAGLSFGWQCYSFAQSHPLDRRCLICARTSLTQQAGILWSWGRERRFIEHRSIAFLSVGPAEGSTSVDRCRLPMSPTGTAKAFFSQQRAEAYFSTLGLMACAQSQACRRFSCRIFMEITQGEYGTCYPGRKLISSRRGSLSHTFNS